MECTAYAADGETFVDSLYWFYSVKRKNVIPTSSEEES